MKKKLKKFAYIAEIISALSVVAGLIFVGLEIRQSTEQSALNTRAIETAAYQDLIGQILQINTAVLTNKELQDVYFRSFNEELTDPIEMQYFGVIQ